MTTAISNKHQLEKAKRYILSDPNRSDMDLLIQDALITANREISDMGGDTPLAWLREQYGEIFTRYYAQISDITAANPGVITAESVDPDLDDDTGFQTGDIVYLDAVNGANSRHRLNGRLFRVVRTAATTITLKTMDGQTDVDTSSYEAYSTGGIIYHAGIVLPRSTIEPTGGTAANEWDIKRVYGVNVDGRPCNPTSHDLAVSQGLNGPGGHPERWRYQQYAYAEFMDADTYPEHLLFWYPYPSQRYQIEVLLEKDYPDLSVWSATAYPPHPPFIHDFVWHRALSNLAVHSEKMKRRSAGKEGEFGDNTKIEILNANYWISKAAVEEEKIRAYSRRLEGNQSYISEGMSA